MEKFIENIISAEKIIKNVDHMIYVTFPLIKDQRLLIKVVHELKDAITNCISSVLQYDYLYKKINLYKNPKSNFRTFVEKCAPRYQITKNEINLIVELFDIIEKHRDSPFEFIKNNKIIILSNGLKPETLGLEKTKEFLILTKEILKKIKKHFRNNFKKSIKSY